MLLPRPETELVVEIALDTIDQYELSSLYELGCGSGIICISLSLARPNTTIKAWDINPKAVALTRRNQLALGATHLTVELNDFFTAVDPHHLSRHHLIIANPPYIRHDVIPTLDPSILDSDPISALDGGADGLWFYRNLIQRYSSSPMVLEIGFDQASDIQTLGIEAGYDVQIMKDYSGHDRIARLIPTKWRNFGC